MVNMWERLSKPSIRNLVIFVLFLISAVIRLARFNPGNEITNMDATYHVLFTVEAMNETPARIHLFLPIVSLGQPSDKGIPWGSTVPDSQRINYYYPSFPALGFIAPYVFFKITGLSLIPRNLMLFGFLIHFIATLLLAKW